MPIKLNTKLWSLVMILFMSVSVSAELTTVNMGIKVTVNPGFPCSINNNSLIMIDFDTVMSNLVDGVNYSRPIPYNVYCSGSVKNAMKMRISGSKGFDSNTVSTNIKNLGIKIKVNNVDVPFDSWISFTYPNFPKLTAIPVKREGTTLVGGMVGKFSTVATIEITYS